MRALSEFARATVPITLRECDSTLAWCFASNGSTATRVRICCILFRHVVLGFSSPFSLVSSDDDELGVSSLSVSVDFLTRGASDH